MSTNSNSIFKGLIPFAGSMSSAFGISYDDTTTSTGNVTVQGVLTWLVDKINIIRSMIVINYSSTSTYAVGDYCRNNFVLYRCTTAITVGEAFNANKWTVTSIMAEILSQNTNLALQTISIAILNVGNVGAIKKTGSVVSFAFGGQFTYTLNANAILCTIPSGYRPPVDIVIRAYNNSTSAECYFYCNASTGGVQFIKGTISATNWVYFNVTYVATQ